MNARLTLALLTASVIVLGVLVVLTFTIADRSPEGIGSGIQSAGSPYLGAARDGGSTPPPSPSFRLADQNGRSTTLAQFRGRPVIVTFLYTHCKNICPATARQISAALDTLRQPVPVVIVSVDPKRDTATAARQFLNKMGLRGRARYLVGTRAQLAPIWGAYGIQPQGATFDHSAYVLVLDARGNQRVAWPVSKLTSDGLAHDVNVVAAARRGVVSTNR